MYIKVKNLKECGTFVVKGHMSKDCWAWKTSQYKKFEKAEKAIDGDLLLCLLTSESKKEIKPKKVRFAQDVKLPVEAGMMCNIGGETFFL